MKLCKKCNTVHVTVINIMKQKCVIWNHFPRLVVTLPGKHLLN